MGIGCFITGMSMKRKKVEFDCEKNRHQWSPIKLQKYIDGSVQQRDCIMCGFLEMHNGAVWKPLRTYPSKKGGKA